jgi:hypothetical protein
MKKKKGRGGGATTGARIYLASRSPSTYDAGLHWRWRRCFLGRRRRLGVGTLTATPQFLYRAGHRGTLAGHTLMGRAKRRQPVALRASAAGLPGLPARAVVGLPILFFIFLSFLFYFLVVQYICFGYRSLFFL